MSDFCRATLITMLTLGSPLPAAADPARDEVSTIALWPAGTKGIDPAAIEAQPSPALVTNVRNPSLTVFRPEKPNGTAVVICPGGGYAVLSIENEGSKVAERLNSAGLTAFVLRYRLPHTEGAAYLDPVPLSDALRAIQWVRAHADDYGIDPARIGLLGFSAGGHLAASAGTRYTRAGEFGADAVSKVSGRPDFVGLVYPVISSDADLRHGCVAKLLPPGAAQEELDGVSPEKLVTGDTPPMFLAHSKDDSGVLPANSKVMHEALQRAGVRSELRLYEQGGHGYGLAGASQDASAWPGEFLRWLGNGGFLPPAALSPAAEK